MEGVDCGFHGLSDRGLLDAYASTKDERAFAEIVRRHGPMVQRLCWRITGDAGAAADAMQVAFFLLADRRLSPPRGVPVSAWLVGIARHAAMEQRRRIRKERLVVEAAARSMSPRLSSQVGMVPTPFQAELDEALQRLPAKFREAIVLRFLEGRTQEEAARMAGCPLGTLAWRTSRGLNALRRRFEKKGILFGIAELSDVLMGEGKEIAETRVPWDPSKELSADRARLEPALERSRTWLRVHRRLRVVPWFLGAILILMVLWWTRPGLQNPAAPDAEPESQLSTPTVGVPYVDGDALSLWPMPSGFELVAQVLRRVGRGAMVDSGSTLRAPASGRIAFMATTDLNGASQPTSLAVLEHRQVSSPNLPLCSLLLFQGTLDSKWRIGDPVEHGAALGLADSREGQAVLLQAGHRGSYAQMTRSREHLLRTQGLEIARASGQEIRDSSMLTLHLTDDLNALVSLRSVVLLNAALARSVYGAKDAPPLALWCFGDGEDPDWIRLPSTREQERPR